MTMRDGIRLGAEDATGRGGEQPMPSWLVRSWARLFAARYDAQAEAGVKAAVGGPLAAHYARLSSRRERDDMVHALTSVIQDAASPTPTPW